MIGPTQFQTFDDKTYFAHLYVSICYFCEKFLLYLLTTRWGSYWTGWKCVSDFLSSFIRFIGSYIKGFQELVFIFLCECENIRFLALYLSQNISTYLTTQLTFEIVNCLIDCALLQFTYLKLRHFVILAAIMQSSCCIPSFRS